MKIINSASILASAVLALASVGAYAQTSTTATVQLQAMVSSFDNITCDTGIVDLNGGMPITNPGPTMPQSILCFVTSNDLAPVNITAYIPDANPLTGMNGNFQIQNFNISAGPAPFDLMPFQPLTIDGLPGNDGVVVATGIPEGPDFPVNFWLQLNVPNNTPADLYTAVLTVAITPMT